MGEDTGRERKRGLASTDPKAGNAAPTPERVEGAAGQSAATGTSGIASPPLDKVDDASDDSFPASDAPAWTGIRVGSPRSDR
jgi:hypothetical protein